MTGFINIDKAVGVSSAREVTKIKRLTNMPCGHMGTLDPMASGVLPVAVGNATRLFDYFLTKKKIYLATFCFGKEYDTLDTTGTLTGEGGRVPTALEIEEVIPRLTGVVMQIPPKYSAKNVGGKRGYQLARQGVEFELPPKKVEIDKIELMGKVDENSYCFKITCGGGTYIRSIARDMAAILDTKAAMSALMRTASGPFTLSNAVPSEDLNEKNIASYLIACDSLLPFESVHLNATESKKLFNGICVECGREDGTYKLYDQNDCFYGLGAVSGGILKARTKLC